MATADRVDLGHSAYTAWTPSAAGLTTEDDDYVGRHRRPGGRSLSLHRMLYTARHRASDVVRGGHRAR